MVPTARILLVAWWSTVTLVAGAPLAWADVVQSPPKHCPPGHTPRTGHYGPYCQPPPPTDCPAGHEPKVRRADAYCEPPPKEPCPKGSFWTSESATEVYCQGGARCDERECSPGETCVDSTLCVQKRHYHRFGFYEIVSGVCKAGGTCAAGTECVTARRCDLTQKRSHPQGVANPAAGTTTAPAATTSQPATPMLGTSTVEPGVTVIPDPGQPPSNQPGAPPPAGTPPATGCASCSLASADDTLPAIGSAVLLLVAGLRRRRSP